MDKRLSGSESDPDIELVKICEKALSDEPQDGEYLRTEMNSENLSENDSIQEEMDDEEDNSCLVEKTTDINSLAAVFEPHTNRGLLHFQISGERYIWIMARFAHSVNPREWYKLFLDEDVCYRKQDGSLEIASPFKILYHFLQLDVMDECIRKKNITDTEKDQEKIRTYLQEHHVPTKNSNWYRVFKNHLVLERRSHNKPKKPSLLAEMTANLLITFCHLKGTTEEEFMDLMREGSYYLKLKAFANTLEDGDAKNIIRHQKFDLPDRYKDLFKGVLPKNYPAVIANSVVRVIREVEDTQKNIEFYREETERTEFTKLEQLVDEYGEQAAKRKKLLLEYEEKTTLSSVRTLHKKLKELKENAAKIAVEKEKNMRNIQRATENRQVIMFLRQVFEKHGDGAEFFDFVKSKFTQLVGSSSPALSIQSSDEPPISTARMPQSQTSPVDKSYASSSSLSSTSSSSSSDSDDCPSSDGDNAKQKMPLKKLQAPVENKSNRTAQFRDEGNLNNSKESRKKGSKAEVAPVTNKKRAAIAEGRKVTFEEAIQATSRPKEKSRKAALTKGEAAIKKPTPSKGKRTKNTPNQATNQIEKLPEAGNVTQPSSKGKQPVAQTRKRPLSTSQNTARKQTKKNDKSTKTTCEKNKTSTSAENNPTEKTMQPPSQKAIEKPSTVSPVVLEEVGIQKSAPIQVTYDNGSFTIENFQQTQTDKGSAQGVPEAIRDFNTVVLQSFHEED